ncbi:hypothetical protein Hamer_G022823 [Homarus americanus]|uniref:Uncharacterized protein n=1 Tax=Homarus americanus TaxID=6706 RepID=A0A8J5T8B4_HOMAM|nr:hypothetical protein Hamer_G022823 [Homarus americanus]
MSAVTSGTGAGLRHPVRCGRHNMVLDGGLHLFTTNRHTRAHKRSMLHTILDDPMRVSLGLMATIFIPQSIMRSFSSAKFNNSRVEETVLVMLEMTIVEICLPYFCRRRTINRSTLDVMRRDFSTR